MTAIVPELAYDDLVVAHNGTGRDASDTENRDLGVVHDRGLEESRELARARHGESRAADFLGSERPGARAVGKPLNLGL